MSKASQQITDMINGFDMAGHPELVASRMLDILAVLNERLDAVEAKADAVAETAARAADVAGCLANGIKPD